MENSLIKYIVYCSTCTTNKKIYIGVHKCNPNIFDGYIGNGIYQNLPSTYEHAKTKYQFAVKKYGPKKFIRSTIAIFDTADEAYDLEAEIVNCDFLKRDDVYNTALGGEGGGYIVTQCATYQYNSEGMFIKEYSSITEAALSVSRNFRSIFRAINDKCKCANYFWTNTKFEKLDLTLMKSYEGRKDKIPVFQYDSDGNYLACYESIRNASNLLKIHSANISNSIKLSSICNGYYFTNVYAPNFSISKFKQITSCEVHQYDLDGNYINSYKTMQEAKNVLKIKSNIYSAIKLGRTCGGFQWSFEKLPKIASITNKAGRKRMVAKYDKNWNLIETYESLNECKKINGSGMIHVLTGRDEFAKGFRYKYLN